MDNKLMFSFLILIGLFSCDKKIDQTSIEVIKLGSIPPSDSLSSKKSKHNENEFSNELQKFIPKNYLILDSISCDLNQDGLNDYLLILKNKNEKFLSDVVDNPEKRPLLILIRNKDNQLELKSKNDNVVYCIDCGGMMGDPYMTLVCKDGFFSIEHYGGSSWRWTRIITFKYNKDEDEWFLHKDGSDSFNVDDIENVETKIKTVKDFGIIKFREFDIYK